MTRLPIILVGFMGAGKTTTGRTLAARLSCGFVDLDELITERAARSPQRIIDEDSEASFRHIESDALHHALAFDRASVIALGGGAWTIEGNRELIAAHGGITVWLDAPFELCRQRIARAGEARPLARDPERAAQLYAQRRALYRLAAHRIEINEAHDAEDVATRIMRLANDDVSNFSSQGNTDGETHE